MPIPISDFATPSWIRYQERYPLSYNKDDRFNEVNPMTTPARSMGNAGPYGGWKYPGYNPNHNSTRCETIKIRSDNLTLRPY